MEGLDAVPLPQEDLVTIVRALTWIDLGFCAAFCLPGLSDLSLQLLDAGSRALGFAAVPAPEGVGAFFVNLAGLFGVLWNVAMLQIRDAWLHRVDLGARALVVGLIAYHCLRSGLSPVFGVIVATECIGAIAKWRWLAKEPSS